MIFLSGGLGKTGRVGLVAMVGFFVILGGIYFSQPKKRDWQTFSKLVKSRVGSGDYLINYNGGAHHLWESKYYGVGAPIYSPGGPLPYYVGTAQMEESDVIYEIPEQAMSLMVISSNSVEETVMEDDWFLNSVDEVDGLKLLHFGRLVDMGL